MTHWLNLSRYYCQFHFFVTLKACESTLLKWILTKERGQNKGTFQNLLEGTTGAGFRGFLYLLHSLQVLFWILIYLFPSEFDSPSLSTTVGLWVLTRGLRSDSFWSSLCLSSCTDSCTAFIWCWNIAKPLNGPTGTLL